MADAAPEQQAADRGPTRAAVAQAIVAYLECVDFDCSGRLRAVAALGAAAVEPLVTLLREGAAPEAVGPVRSNATLVRMRSAIALGALREPRALAALIGAVGDPDPLVRAEVARALGGLGRQDAVLPALLRMLGDPDPLVRETTAGALGRLGDRAALASLRRAAESEPAPHVRAAIREAIDALESRR